MTTTEADYAGKRVLVTGGTGSFGKTVTRHLLDRDVTEVRILSRDEAKQHDMRVLFDDPRLNFFVGDVRNSRSVDRAARGVDMIFHAAALKQVPSCEFFPLEAVLTNVLGSQNVVEAAEKNEVGSVVFLSTDKAVLPVNAMGMSKALMEKVAQAAARAQSAGTIVSTVRYGNVLYSRGSVVPLFVDKIFRGEPLTITDPDMTRFLMPLSQAVDLVEFAFFNAEAGDTFIRKAAAATIGDLATAVNELFGSPVATKIIGVRHGEKTYETLATAEELRGAQDMGDYWRLRMDSRDLNYADYFEVGKSTEPIDEDYHSHNTELLDIEGVKKLLLGLPEIQADLERWSA
ncbi:MAG: polysaccharide biosynthesis protein [Acidimicrobiales bacterium]